MIRIDSSCFLSQERFNKLKSIEEVMHLRDKLLKSKKHEYFKKQRNKVTYMLRAAKKTHFQHLIASKHESRSIRKAINNLPNKAKSNPQMTTKDISPDKLNIHFAK